MHINCTHDDNMVWITATTEESASTSSTVTWRMSVTEAISFCAQLTHTIDDWHINRDPHEKATLLGEYQEERREIEVDLAYVNEPF